MKGKKKKGNFIFDSVLALLLFAGVSLLLYPTFSNWWNASRQSQAISDYAGKVDEMDAEEYARLWREAWEYNRALAEQSTRYALTAAYTTGIADRREHPDPKGQLPCNRHEPGAVGGRRLWFPSPIRVGSVGSTVRFSGMVW